MTGRQGDQREGLCCTSDLDPRRLSRNAVAFRSKIEPPSSPGSVFRTGTSVLAGCELGRSARRGWLRDRLRFGHRRRRPDHTARGSEGGARSLLRFVSKQSSAAPLLPKVSGRRSESAAFAARVSRRGIVIFLSEGNVKRSRDRDPHEVRARECFTFREGPTRVQYERETKPLPLITLSPCLPVNLDRTSLNAEELTSRRRRVRARMCLLARS